MTRELPHAEWNRLVGTELESVWRSLSPDWATVLVVEDDGVIVGTWALMTVLHAEGLSIAPAYRNHGNVARRLLRGMGQLALRAGVTTVLTAAKDDAVRNYLRRIGAVPLPEHFAMPVSGVKESELCQQP